MPCDIAHGICKLYFSLCRIEGCSKLSKKCTLACWNTGTQEFFVVLVLFKCGSETCEM